ncbi:MAG TPA: MaoC/PaaZ C-terminal domain-containing protein [Chitinophagaceae bacterium]|jgi:acyl dehydratase|nr:MaoC/PaaZ C-terminal domain-containing protein [Chitinophagaceae bacterium]
MFTKAYFEEFNLNDLRETGRRTVTETDIVIHAGQTGDFFPHHMDEEWCKTQPFTTRIAHGTLIFSIAVGMSARLPLVQMVNSHNIYSGNSNNI